MFIRSLLFLFVLTLFSTTSILAESADGNAITPTPSVSQKNNYRLQVREAREEFRQKLSQLKDARKKAIVEKIDARIAEINLNRTAIMTNHLNQIEAVLNKLETRANTAKTNGKNVSSVETAIASARAAIATARQNISDQAAKQYVINITSETNLGAAVSVTRQAFANDLQVTHKSVVSARQTVAAAISTLAQILGGTIIN